MNLNFEGSKEKNLTQEVPEYIKDMPKSFKSISKTSIGNVEKIEQIEIIEEEKLKNSKEFCVRSLNAKLFHNYKSTLITNLLEKDLLKLYKDIK